MATPSLAMIPSAYADSKVYSVLPNNGDGDFTFNRDSSATRVGQNGLIQTVGYFGNELITNGSFATDSDWTKGSGWTISGGTANSDGTANNALNQYLSIPTGKLRIKFDVTARTQGSVRLFIDKPVFTELLDESAIGSYEVDVDTTSNTGRIWFYSTSNFIGSIDNVSVQQILGDQPRLNYDISNGVVQSCPSLLLEPASTNLVTYSEDFSQSDWVKNNTSVASGFTSPDGTNNAYLMTDDATDSKHGVYKLDVLSQDGNIYTRSVFIKKGTARYVVLSARHLPTSSGTSWIYDFNINNWVLTGSTGAGQSIEDYGNGWYRLSISHISNSNFNNDFSIGISSGATIADTSYSGVGDTVQIWGVQIEQQSYPTSYIPTNGSSQTRAAETCNGAGNAATFNDSEGVLYAEISALADDGTNRGITISDGTVNNRVTMFYTNVSNAIQVKVVVGGVTSLNNYITISNTSEYNKFALKYKQNDFSLFVNGVELIADTSGNTFANGTLTKLAFDRGDGADDFYGNCKDIRVYNEALTDTQLQKLTTL